jgi:hypothetical protein
MMAVLSLAAGALGAVSGNGTLLTIPMLGLAGIPIPSAGWSDGVGVLAGSLGPVLGVGEAGETGPSRAELAVLRLSAVMVATAAAGGMALMITVPPASQPLSGKTVLVAVPLALIALQIAIGQHGGARTPGAGPPLALTALAAGTAFFAGYVGAGQAMVAAAATTILPAELARLREMQFAVVVLTDLLSAGALLLDRTGLPAWALAILAAGSMGGGLLGVASRGRVPAAVGRAALMLVSAAALAKILATGGGSVPPR